MSDAVFRIATELHKVAPLPGCKEDGRNPRKLTVLQSATAIEQILLKAPERFPVLLRGHKAGGDLSSLRRFLDVSRSSFASERIISRIVDEAGNTIPGELRAAELIALLDDYQAFQRSELLFDGLGVLEVLVEAFALERFRDALRGGLLPQQIICDSPTYFSPLAVEFWQGIAAFTKVTFTVSARIADAVRNFKSGEPLPPSLRRAQGVIEFLAANRAPFEIVEIPEAPERRALVSWVIDGEAAPSDPELGGVSILSCADERREAQAVAERVKEALARTRPEDITVLLLRPEKSGDLVRRELQYRDIPCSSVAAKPFRGTPAASLFEALVRWANVPSLENAALLWGSALAAPCVPAQGKGSAALEELCRAHEYGQIVESSPRALLDIAGHAVLSRELQTAPLDRKTIDAVGMALARYFSLSLRKKLFDRERSALISELFTAAYTLRALETLVKEALELQNEELLSSAARGLRRAFTSVRLRWPRHEPGSRFEREEHTLGARRLRESLDELRVLDDFERPAEGSALSRISELFRSNVSSLKLPVQRRPGGVIVTDLSSTRTLAPAEVFIAGMSASAFPQISAEEDDPGGVLGGISRALRDGSGVAAQIFESYGLLSELLLSAKRATFSVARETEAGEVAPHLYLSALAKVLPAAEVTVLPAAPAAAESFSAPRLERFLHARAADSLSAYDGMIGAAEVEQHASFGKNGHRRYSASSLQMLKECPHRFFFRYFLRIPNKEPPSERVPQVVGNLVHDALDAFAKRDGHSLLRADFERGCTVMAEISHDHFRRSEFDWEANYLLAHEKASILFGLDQPHRYTGRRGYLRLALEIQRELLEGAPFESEFPFGARDGAAVTLAEAGIHFHGKIDLIQGLEDGLFDVWDFKVKKFNKSKPPPAIQLALYSHAVQTLLPPHGLPRRAGMIFIGEYVRSLDELHERAGELLTEPLAKSRGKADPAEKLRNGVETQLQVITSLDGLVREGKLHQIRETNETVCRYCECRHICSRDQARLNEIAEGRRKGELEFSEVPPPDFPVLRSLPPLNEEQHAAISGGPATVLVAGAGSGKTHVLRTAIVRLVRAGEPLLSIVALTFTEKAAAEIRVRIEEALIDALVTGSFDGTPLLPEERARFVEARALLPLAAVGTIHSFCRTVLRLGGGSGPAIITAAQRAAMFTEALDEVLSDPASEAAAEAKHQSFHHGYSLSQIERLVSELVKNPDRLPDLQAMFSHLESDPAHGARLRRDLLTELEFLFAPKWQATLAAWLRNERAVYENGRAEKLDAIERADHEKLFCDVEDALAALEERTGAAAAALSRLEQQVHASPYMKKRSRSGTGECQFKSLRDELKKFALQQFAEGSGTDSEGMSFLAALVALSAEVDARLAAMKAEQGICDFDDLIRGAHALVCGAPATRDEALLERLKRRFRHFLVDEFQDTDPKQWEIVRALAGDAENGTLCIVGDPQQAIYGFRAGDVRVFNRSLTELAAAGGKSSVLRRNHRAHPALVDFANVLFDPIFAAEFNEDGSPRISTAVKFQPLVPVREPDAAPHPRVAVLETRVSPPKTSKKIIRATEAEDVARFISAVLQEGLQEGLEETSSGKSSRWPALQPGSRSIAVLCRKTSELVEVANALRFEGISFSVFQSDGFFELDEILQFENLLKALSTPPDPIALAGVLRSALIGLDDLEMSRLFSSVDQRYELLFSSAASDAKELREHVFARLSRWKAASTRMTASRLIDLVCHDVLCDRQNNGLRRYSGELKNIFRLIDELRAAEQDGTCDGSLSSAISWFELNREGGGAAPDSYDGAHPVVLMTVHKAKGLEFPMVILPFLEWNVSGHAYYERITGGEAPLSYHDVSPALVSLSNPRDEYRLMSTVERWLSASRDARERAETRRLFYVACTRAREYLVFAGRLETNDPGRDVVSPAALFLGDNPKGWLEEMLCTENGHLRVRTWSAGPPILKMSAEE